MQKKKEKSFHPGSFCFALTLPLILSQANKKSHKFSLKVKKNQHRWGVNNLQEQNRKLEKKFRHPLTGFVLLSKVICSNQRKLENATTTTQSRWFDNGSKSLICCSSAKNSYWKTNGFLKHYPAQAVKMRVFWTFVNTVIELGEDFLGIGQIQSGPRDAFQFTSAVRYVHCSEK